MAQDMVRAPVMLSSSPGPPIRSFKGVDSVIGRRAVALINISLTVRSLNIRVVVVVACGNGVDVWGVRGVELPEL